MVCGAISIGKIEILYIATVKLSYVESIFDLFEKFDSFSLINFFCQFFINVGIFNCFEKISTFIFKTIIYYTADVNWLKSKNTDAKIWHDFMDNLPNVLLYPRNS